MRSIDILEEHLADEANVSLERGLPTVRAAKICCGGVMRECEQSLVDALADVFGDTPEAFYPLILAAVRLDAAPDALLNLRTALARAIARFNVSDVLTAQRHEAEEMAHG